MNYRRDRADLAGLAAPIRKADGAVVYAGFAARTGAHEYSWGTEHRDDRELDSIARQLPGAAVVVGHPATLMRDGGAAEVVGRVMSARRADDHIEVELSLDERGAGAVEAGARQISLGYSLDSGRGEPHRGTKVDHLALVTTARCGPSCAVRVDGQACACGTCYSGDVRADLGALSGAKTSMATNTDNQAALADALAKISALEAQAGALKIERDEQKTRADKAQGEVDSLKTRVDSLEKARAADDSDSLRLTVQGLNTQLAAEKRARADAEDPAKLRTAVRARVDLETRALAVFGDKDRTRVDAMSDREVMVAVVEKLHNASIESGKSDDYVRARFDAAVEGFAAGAKALANLRESAAPEKQEQRVDARTAREQMIARNRDAWKQAPAAKA